MSFAANLPAPELVSAVQKDLSARKENQDSSRKNLFDVKKEPVKKLEISNDDIDELSEAKMETFDLVGDKSDSITPRPVINDV